MLQQRLANSTVHNVQELPRGVSNAQLIELDDGLRAVFKTTYNDDDSANFRHELLLYRLDNLIGTHVVPITTTRTLKGKEGSVQLFIENSISAGDIVVARRRQLGLLDSLSSYHLLFSDALAPPVPPAINTLRLLSLEDDVNNWGNYLLPRRGRQIAIDGGHAFIAHEDIVAESIQHLREHPETYLLDAALVAKVEENIAAIEEMFDDRRRQSWQETFANYRKMVADNPHRVNDDKEDEAQLLLQALRAEDWQAADRLVAVRDDLFTLETGELLKVARYQRNWQLIAWMQRHDAQLSSYHQVLEYALSAGDNKFAARLSALGVDTRETFAPLHKNLLRTLAQRQNVQSIDWHNFDWQAIDWRTVRSVDDMFYTLKNEASDQLLDYLKVALDAGDWPAAKRMLHNFRKIPSQQKPRKLIDLLDFWLVNTNPQAAARLTEHKVVLDILSPLKDDADYVYLFDRLHTYMHHFHYYEVLEQEHATMIAFLFRILAQYKNYSSFNNLEEIYRNKKLTKTIPSTSSLKKARNTHRPPITAHHHAGKRHGSERHRLPTPAV